MKVFVAGATGVVGRPLVTELVARGHEVTGMTRSVGKQDLVRGSGRGRSWRMRSTAAPSGARSPTRTPT